MHIILFHMIVFQSVISSHLPPCTLLLACCPYWQVSHTNVRETEHQNSLILSPSTSLCVSIRILGFNSKHDPGDRVHMSGRSSKGSYACECGLSVTKTPMLHKIIPIIFCLYPSPELSCPTPLKTCSMAQPPKSQALYISHLAITLVEHHPHSETTNH